MAIQLVPAQANTLRDDDIDTIELFDVGLELHSYQPELEVELQVLSEPESPQAQVASPTSELDDPWFDFDETKPTYFEDEPTEPSERHGAWLRALGRAA